MPLAVAQDVSDILAAYLAEPQEIDIKTHNLRRAAHSLAEALNESVNDERVLDLSTVNPEDPIVIKQEGSPNATVLVPGDFQYAHEASEAALTILSVHLADVDPDIIDEKGYTEVYEPEYIVIGVNPADPVDLFIKVADDGPATPNANLYTRVDVIVEPDA